MSQDTDFGFDRANVERTEARVRRAVEFHERIVATIEAIRLHGTRTDLESPNGPHALAIRLHAFCEIAAFTDIQDRLTILNPKTPVQRCVVAVMASAFIEPVDNTAELIRKAVQGYSTKSLVDFCQYFHADWNVASLMWNRKSFHDVEDSPQKSRKPTAVVQAGSADNAKKDLPKVPDNPDVLALCKMLAKRRTGTSLNEVARTFTNEPKHNWPRAKNLLRQAQRFPHLWKLGD